MILYGQPQDIAPHQQWSLSLFRALSPSIEIDHNSLCQPHNKTISELNVAGLQDEWSWTGGRKASILNINIYFLTGDFGWGRQPLE